VALVRSDVSEDHIASIRVERTDTKITLSVNIVRVDSNLSDLPNNAVSYLVYVARIQKSDTWITLLRRPFRLNSTLTIWTERVGFVSANHWSFLFAP
jgi:hypothetical protein